MPNQATETSPRSEGRAAARFRAYGPTGLRANRVDRANRVIYGYSVITRGEALGHDVWIDDIMLDQVVSAGNAKMNGTKTRFTHPGLCSDGLGKFLGRSKNFRRDGNLVRADLHFSAAASGAPEMDNDPVKYLMNLAEEDPQAFAASIIYWPDYGAEDRFVAEHEDENGKFVSPDAANKRNYIHARLTKLDASDIVDEPAANPGGFFSFGEEKAVIAEQALSWIFGLSDIAPSAEALGGGQPDRIREFVRGFMARHGIAFTPNAPATGKELQMAEPKPEATPPVTPDPMQAAREQFAANLKALKDAFPKDEAFAVQCAADGLDVIAAQAKYSVVLQAKFDAQVTEIAGLKTKYEALEKENAGIKQQLLSGAPPQKPAPEAATPPATEVLEVEAARKYAVEHKCSLVEAFRALAQK